MLYKNKKEEKEIVPKVELKIFYLQDLIQMGQRANLQQ